MITIEAAASVSPAGTLIERTTLSGGARVALRAARGRFVVLAQIRDASGQQTVEMVMTPSHLTRLAGLATAKRLVRSLRLLPSDIIRGRPPCQYPAVFAAVAMVAGARTAQCPRWLPSSITLDLASAGPLDEYNPVEFHGAVGGGFPHLVFEWVTGAPPGRQLRSMQLNNGRSVPLYFQPPGVAMNSNHLIASFSPASAHPRFWVSLHNSYGSVRATAAVLRRVVESLLPLDPLSGRRRP